jgi:F-type H+-transporting ATPase subunit b
MRALIVATLLAGLMVASPAAADVHVDEPAVDPHTMPEPYPTTDDEHHAASPIANFWQFDYGKKNAEGGEYKAGDHHMPAPFLMALLNFAVLCILFAKFVVPGLKKSVREKHDLIAKQLEESSRLRDQAAAKLKEYEAKVVSLDADIAALVQGLRAEGEAEKARIIAEAETRAQRLRKDAEQQIQAEIARVRVGLEREVTLAAIAAAEQLLRERTTDADQQALTDSFVQAIAKQPAPRA